MIRPVARLTIAIALTASVVQFVSAAPSPPPRPPALPGLSAAADTQMEVAGAYANLRAKPTTQAKLLAKLDHATKVDILGKVEHDRWYHVKANGIEGYIRADLLKYLGSPSSGRPAGDPDRQPGLGWVIMTGSPKLVAGQAPPAKKTSWRAGSFGLVSQWRSTIL
jgi:hypothetical protein